MFQVDIAEAYQRATTLLGQNLVAKDLVEQQFAESFVLRQAEDGSVGLVHVRCGERAGILASAESPSVFTISCCAEILIRSKE